MLKKSVLRCWLLCALALALAFTAHHGAYALSSEWQQQQNHRLRVFYAGQEEGALRIGVHMRLDGGWKTYWRAPGDAGEALRLEWLDGSTIKEAVIRWPAPARFLESSGLESWGYKEEIVFPLRAPGAAPAVFAARLNYMICNDSQCIPQQVETALPIPEDAQAAPEDAALYARYVALEPQANGTAGLHIGDADIREQSDQGGTLRVSIASEQGFVAPDVFIEGPPLFRFPKPEITVGSEGRSAVALFRYETALKGKSLAGQNITLTLTDAGRAITATAPVAVAQPKANLPQEERTGAISSGAEEIRALSLSKALFFALLGGLILNLMPCVLPVLSIKILGVLNHSGMRPARIRLAFLMTAAGILASFLVLAALVWTLQAAGHAVGWGFHFQQPAFLIALALILTLFAANMWGWFEFRLPAWLGGAIEGVGPSRDDHSLAGHFLMGAFATLLATPCTAPFLGTAAGFALSQGAGYILLVFLFMGLGLALPYLTVAVCPSAVTRLPKPGIWMIRIRQLLGLMLLATVFWLVWVLAAQLGRIAALIVLVLVLAKLLLLSMAQHMPFFRRLGILVTAMVLLTVLAFILPNRFESAPMNETQRSGLQWQPFERERISAWVAEGKTVFVDVTADWCLTCKANKLAVIDRGEVQRALSAPHVIAMRADYTKPSLPINRFLSENGRFGIPFNVVYGPAAPGGIVLPEVLTVSIVLEALEKASGK